MKEPLNKKATLEEAQKMNLEALLDLYIWAENNLIKKADLQIWLKEED